MPIPSLLSRSRSGLRDHVVFGDTGNGYRFLHGVAAERLTQFLVQADFDQRGLAILHLILDRLVQRGGQVVHVVDGDTFEAASLGALQGILGYETRPLVSTDYTNDARSSIVDAPSTMVVNGTQVKVYAWYDNEWGYAHRLIDVARMVGNSI